MSVRSAFSDLFDQGQGIEIPKIQRDYAQGRDDPRTRDVRVRFLDALHDAVVAEPDERARPLDLDFVYGHFESKRRLLEPLDGQQRLTTLFLLHWYLAAREGQYEDLLARMQANGRSRFTYDTRPSAREFFDDLVNHGAGLEPEPGEGGVSRWIRDQTWFVATWLRDPTVRGCLVTLDAIHDRFKDAAGCYARLVDRESPPIVFRLLRLEQYALSDDLYIKMNARGKALTSFEVFKAQLEHHVGEIFDEEVCPHDPDGRYTWRGYLAHRFDGAWTDLLWRYRDPSDGIDDRMMHIVRAVAWVSCVLDEPETNDDDTELERQIEQLIETRQPSLHDYLALGCLNRAFVDRLVRVLDRLATRTEETPGFLSHAKHCDEQALLRRLMEAKSQKEAGGMTYADWVEATAYTSFLIASDGGLDEDERRARFSDWMRVICNLARNTEIERISVLLAALRGVRRLVAAGIEPDFLPRVGDGLEMQGFSRQQRREERLKAQLIGHDTRWRAVLEDAEDHACFGGHVGFALDFAGVVSRWDDDEESCRWSSEEDDAFREHFADWWKRTGAAFPPGSPEGPLALGREAQSEWLWERAVLSMGDYLRPFRANRSLLRHERGPGWKQLLRNESDDGLRCREMVRQALAALDPEDVVGSLRRIVGEGLAVEDGNTDVWRRRLVADPRLLDECRRGMLRFQQGTVLVLNLQQRNGYHKDLFSFDLYLQLKPRLERGELRPLTQIRYEGVRGDSELPNLRVTCRGVRLQAESKNDAIHFGLRAPSESASALPEVGWEYDGERFYTLSVPWDEAEDAVVAMAASLAANA